MTGYIVHAGAATGIHDPLYAKALVLENGATQGAIHTVDVLGLHWPFVISVRTAIAAAAGIPAVNVLITCSHTHAGPATLFLEGCSAIDEGYLAHLHQQLVAVTHRAWTARQPARLGVGHGQGSEGVHNRRHYRTPGATRRRCRLRQRTR